MSGFAFLPFWKQIRIDPVRASRLRVESGKADPHDICPACRRHLMWTAANGDRACVDPACAWRDGDALIPAAWLEERESDSTEDGATRDGIVSEGAVETAGPDADD